MSSHRIDAVSLVGGVVFLSFGLVGLLRSAGWIEHGAVFWVAVVLTAGLGCAGAVSAIRGLTSTNREPRSDGLVLADDA